MWRTRNRSRARVGARRRQEARICRQRNGIRLASRAREQRRLPGKRERRAGAAARASWAVRRDMTESGGHTAVVRARFDFQRNNEDELSFSKGDIITVTRPEDGGWWEGTLAGRTGWFPSNYVRELKGNERPTSPKSKSTGKSVDSPISNKGYYNVVLQNIVETEREYCRELQHLLGNFLRPLHNSDKLSATDVSTLMGNLEDVCAFQQGLVQALEDCTKLPESQQTVGGCFMSLMNQMHGLYLAYCCNHPWAVRTLQEHSEMLGEFMESKGVSSPGLLMLTTSLSKPFMRLDKYPTLLKELERHMEDIHPDRNDIHGGMTAFKTLATQCREMRKRKELELQMMTEPIRGWEGEDMKALGSIVYMSQAVVQATGSEDRTERFLLLFPSVLVLLSASPRMSGFIFQGKFPLSGMSFTKMEDGDVYRNAFEINGNTMDRMLVWCQGPQEVQAWLEHLHRQSRTTPHGGASILKSTQSHSLPAPVLASATGKHADGASKPLPVNPGYRTLPLAGSHGSHGAHHVHLQTWGLLEPPKTAKPWSLSCLRPAPPLRPSAALIYKEELSRSPKTMKKLLPSRKTRKPSDEDFVRKSSAAALEEDTQILKVIEAYCTSGKTRQTLNSTWQATDLMHNHVLSDCELAGPEGMARHASLSRWDSADLLCNKDVAPQVLLPEEEKMIVEERKSNGQTVTEEKSLVDTVYALKDQIQELRQETRRLRHGLEEEAKSRKELEKILKRCLKVPNDASWDETNL
ncbi:rho guanine nucleotide exchange factor 7 isoform X5 [Lethenteron reissneri]|uniref:rho guanine nucleotide exchange factor 7 isoform X5 n=1 Tax=Lethenteron reissneri TaxID=7753 RepID=UPI002AB78417|nr:rho guanine nucleotide exchange factor 7 isoform X5 [Lethenteron reissneri]